MDNCVFMLSAYVSNVMETCESINSRKLVINTAYRIIFIVSSIVKERWISMDDIDICRQIIHCIFSRKLSVDESGTGLVLYYEFENRVCNILNGMINYNETQLKRPTPFTVKSSALTKDEVE